eukprot:NODE_1020_length_1318_cov_163.136328_g731_i2.p1 GENE.NODE_1020_length_1318_cov_163.136328_g731_i2~~NODE_1020_length_1318_cov_163.136328_g731_i2.p1  ORF type:complete len:295 (+),score=19.25 NODE_1020_length_1318_cov_163.136328_g731_i2:304-1188(+)
MRSTYVDVLTPANHSNIPLLVQLNLATTELPVVFVGHDGDPRFCTGSRRHPFYSLQDALKAVQIGQSIVLLPGRYPKISVANIHGTQQHPVQIRGFARESVFIQSEVGVESIVLRNCRRVVISDMTVIDSTTGVKINDDCVYITVTRISMVRVKFGTDAPPASFHGIAVRDCSIVTHTKGKFDSFRVKFGNYMRGASANLWSSKWSYLGWVIAVSWIAFCVIVFLSYAQKFSSEADGDKQVNKWLFLCIQSFVMDVFFVQPARIGVLEVLTNPGIIHATIMRIQLYLRNPIRRR